MSTCSVVVPATNAPPTLGRCLAAIHEAADGPDEVVVVDGPDELSASGARNEGVRRATGEIVVFVDADVEVHADAFARLRAAFDADPDRTAVFGSYDDRPDHPGVVSRFRNLLHHHVHQHGAGPAETFWTGLGAVRREAFLAIGGFDEVRYPHPSIEDIDLGTRLCENGAVVALDPAIQGTHLKHWTLGSMLWTDLVHRGIPWVVLQLRTGRLSTTLNLGWRHRLSALVTVMSVLAVLLWQPALVLVGAGLFVGLNHAFYALLIRQLGVLQGAAGVALHGLHHLVAVAAVPAGIAVAIVAGVATWRASEEPVIGTVAE
ncbi:MAG: glycosyltransferase family A protein [Acidimicrobiales bacterium]|nr:glycosyltransferase family A protein [Acidimicrobiales bacterium]